MSGFQLAGLLLTIVAILGYINHRFIRLPDTIGITAVGMMLSIGLMVAGHLKLLPLLDDAKAFVGAFDFSDLVFNGFLGLLLFAGALHVDVRSIQEHRKVIGLLATLGVVLSTTIAGLLLYGLLWVIGLNLSLWWCLAFGALISPTDPVAVLSVLKGSDLPKPLSDKLTGESLFNDGVAVVLFVTLVGLATGKMTDPSGWGVAKLLLSEIAGAVIVGGVLGFAATWVLRRVDSHAVEIFITLSLATAGYALAAAVHASAPLAVVLMGLIVGSNGFRTTMTVDRSQQRLFDFWDLLDELLNFALFGLIGLMVLALEIKAMHLLVGVLTIGIVLASRYLSVGIPLGALQSESHLSSRVRAKILTWGGLRGGVSIALALSLPNFAGRNLIQTVTYVIVAFSLLVQATTIKRLVAHCIHPQPEDAAPTSPPMTIVGMIKEYKANQKCYLD